jgi:hypothetical protein
MSVSNIEDILTLFHPTKELVEIEIPEAGAKYVEKSVFKRGGSYEPLNKIIYFITKNKQYDNEDNLIIAANEYLDHQSATVNLMQSKALNNLIRFEDNLETLFKDKYILSLIVGAMSTNELFDKIKSDQERLTLDAKNYNRVRDYIINAIQEGEIKERLGLSGIIDFVVKSEFSYNKAAVRVANQVQKKINELDSIQITVNSEESTLFNLVKREEGGNFYYKVWQNYSQSKGIKIDERALPDELKANIDVPMLVKGGYKLPTPGIVGLSEPLAQFPDGVYDADSPALEVLKNDTSLADKDIRTYDFLNYQDQPNTEGFFGNFDWSRDSKSPDELIEINLRNKYAEFILKLMEDYTDDRLLEITIGGTYIKVFDNNFISLIYGRIAVDKEVNRRIKEFRKLAELSKDLDLDAGEQLTPEDIKEAEVAGAKGFTESVVDDPPPEDEDIENRQKYFKQCALMLNLSKLRDTYQEKLNEQYSNKLPYGGRFTTLYCKDKEQELLLTRLVSSKNEQKLFELETHKISKLVPKIRLFKVFNSTDGGEKEVEFIFDRTSKQRDSFMSATFDKGNGVGLKNFSFEFNGTSPATARNDITASLTLFFQSFEDFTRTRTGYSDKYRYVDLVIQPTPDKQGEVGGIEILSDRQYEPQFYRIRADVGYVLPTEADGFTSDEITAIRVSNKSFFLNMVDHDISFGKDGTVEIKISYRAYLESLLKHPRLDALASPELIARRIANAREFTKQIRDKKCSVEQLKELQVSLAAQEAVLVKQSLSSIVTRLRDRGVIYTTLIKKKHKEFFLKKGFFRKCDFETDAVSDGSNGADVKLVLNSDLPESSDDFDFIDSGNRAVQFFYFGDLLYTVLDCVYDSNNEVRKGTGYNRNSIVLGSFEFEAFQKSSKEGNVYNIADIPISVDFFSRWFVDNVVSQKSTRKTFPLMNFIRSLSNYLIRPAIVENCVNRKIETKLRFQTSQVTAFEPNGVNPLHKHYKLGDGGRTPVALDVASLRKGSEPTLPLKGGPVSDANSNFKDFHTFVILTALGSSLSYAGNGKYSDDIDQGRFHVHVGQNAGLVKTLSLSKSDQQYIREARFFQNGIDGLLQLSAVYVANIEMFGNVLFYPGMEFFFNPYGIGGPEFDPTKKASDANKLGIGGYHTITSVKSSISPGKFTTTIAGQQYYSGDGSGNPNTVKQKNADAGAVGSIEEYKPVDETEGNDGFKECNQVILDAQNYAFEEGTAAGRITGVVGAASGTAPVETANNESGKETPPAEAVTSVRATVDAILNAQSEPKDDSTSVVTGANLAQKPTEVEGSPYSGKLRTITASQTSTSATASQFLQQSTEEGGRFTEMSDGTVYFQKFLQPYGFGPKIEITDHTRIIKQ